MMSTGCKKCFNGPHGMILVRGCKQRNWQRNNNEESWNELYMLGLAYDDCRVSINCTQRSAKSATFMLDWHGRVRLKPNSITLRTWSRSC